MTPAPSPLSRVSAVVVSYNSAAVIADCLTALPNAVRVVLVDNDSTDDTLDRARAARPGLTIHEMGRNAGYGSAANAGFALADTPYGLLVNPDAEVPEDALLSLIAYLDSDADAAIAAPHLSGADGAPEPVFNASLDRRESWPKELRRRVAVADGPACADFLLGAVMLIRLAAFRAVGGFDEDLFLYYEDDDLCRRLREAGHSLVVEPAARCRHLGGGSSGVGRAVSTFKETAITRSRLVYTEKTRGRDAAVARADAILRHARPRRWLYLLLGRAGRAALLKARIDAARGFLAKQRP
ncbi:MAG: glycosyltransferase family 2 protein [Alphaproteobacteria bacterium]|nr:glycosyltransferase family 2 protein [Alphaproteobacteria bacterium]